jgi:hypothetical protein
MLSWSIVPMVRSCVALAPGMGTSVGTIPGPTLEGSSIGMPGPPRTGAPSSCPAHPGRSIHHRQPGPPREVAPLACPAHSVGSSSTVSGPTPDGSSIVMPGPPRKVDPSPSSGPTLDGRSIVIPGPPRKVDPSPPSGPISGVAPAPSLAPLEGRSITVPPAHLGRSIHHRPARPTREEAPHHPRAHLGR